MPIVINGGVEGSVDQAMLARLVRVAGAELGTVYGLQGKPKLLSRVRAFNAAAAYKPWVVLVDLDRESGCPPAFVRQHLPQRSRWMCFRVVVKAAEAWLLADGDRIASYLGIPLSKVPVDPESLTNPKQTLVNLVRTSSKRAVRLDMVPSPRSGRQVGPAYASRVIEFIDDETRGWRPDAAARRAPSLARAMDCLTQLVAGA